MFKPSSLAAVGSCSNLSITFETPNIANDRQQTSSIELCPSLDGTDVHFGLEAPTAQGPIIVTIQAVQQGASGNAQLHWRKIAFMKSPGALLVDVDMDKAQLIPQLPPRANTCTSAPPPLSLPQDGSPTQTYASKDVASVDVIQNETSLSNGPYSLAPAPQLQAAQLLIAAVAGAAAMSAAVFLPQRQKQSPQQPKGHSRPIIDASCSPMIPWAPPIHEGAPVGRWTRDSSGRLLRDGHRRAATPAETATRAESPIIKSQCSSQRGLSSEE